MFQACKNSARYITVKPGCWLRTSGLYAALNRQQELNIAKSSAIGNVRIIDSAVAQPKPVKPKKVIILLVGIVLGGIVSVGLILLRVFLRRGIDSPEQLEELGINVYASIPVSKPLQKRSVQTLKLNKKTATEYESFLAVENPADLAIEAIRGYVTSLHFCDDGGAEQDFNDFWASPNAGKLLLVPTLRRSSARQVRRFCLLIWICEKAIRISYSI